MKKNNSNQQNEPIDDSVRLYQQFCFLRGLEPKAGESLEAFKQYTILQTTVNASIFGASYGLKEPLTADNAIEQLNALISEINGEC